MYYEVLNKTTSHKFGTFHSCKVKIKSVGFCNKAKNKKKVEEDVLVDRIKKAGIKIPAFFI